MDWFHMIAIVPGTRVKFIILRQYAGKIDTSSFKAFTNQYFVGL